VATLWQPGGGVGGEGNSSGADSGGDRRRSRPLVTAPSPAGSGQGANHHDPRHSRSATSREPAEGAGSERFPREQNPVPRPPSSTPFCPTEPSDPPFLPPAQRQSLRTHRQDDARQLPPDQVSPPWVLHTPHTCLCCRSGIPGRGQRALGRSCGPGGRGQIRAALDPRPTQGMDFCRGIRPAKQLLWQSYALFGRAAGPRRRQGRRPGRSLGLLPRSPLNGRPRANAAVRFVLYDQRTRAHRPSPSPAVPLPRTSRAAAA
jgi:hypothetical protein